MTSSHISTSAATSCGASERPDAISVDAYRALSPEAKAARRAAIAALPPEEDDDGPGPAMSVDAYRALSPAAKAARRAEFDAWEKRQTAVER
ncbi:hypothetical protein [Rhodococcus cercidiphylli]|uniref:Uncharacterized protein n=1 Tax=Rhodococcus cercidiphylli TaxID=489916 RepID=A0ABU4AXD0_9NOCA|nr:hypothetical protein [Rhodococcus cercidiphylli]MDV6230876.1 hypothetical protein [Rhodococcus cercidiphylli]